MRDSPHADVSHIIVQLEYLAHQALTQWELPHLSTRLAELARSIRNERDAGELCDLASSAGV